MEPHPQPQSPFYKHYYCLLCEAPRLSTELGIIVKNTKTRFHPGLIHRNNLLGRSKL